MSILSVSTMPGLSSYCQVIVADEERLSSCILLVPGIITSGLELDHISPTFLTTRIPCLLSFTQPLPGPVRFNYGSEPCGGIDKRKQEAERIRNKYNDRIPVSISRADSGSTMGVLFAGPSHWECLLINSTIFVLHCQPHDSCWSTRLNRYTAICSVPIANPLLWLHPGHARTWPRSRLLPGHLREGGEVGHLGY